jgi:hypothetical protein
MPAAGQTVELVETKEIQLFLPVVKEIDLGDRFLLSMLHWCGIGRRSTPPDYWKVFLLRAAGEIVGVSGLYRQPGMAQTVCWSGWFGIRPRFDDKALASVLCKRLSPDPSSNHSEFNVRWSTNQIATVDRPSGEFGRETMASWATAIYSKRGLFRRISSSS